MGETYINGHSALEENIKNVTMQVYHSEIVENKTDREAEYKNISIVTENNNVAVSDVSSKQIEESNRVEAPKPRDGIYELCNSRREKLLPFLKITPCYLKKWLALLSGKLIRMTNSNTVANYQW